MSFNLNDENFGGGGVTVFNNGNTGKVENVKMYVTKKSPEDNDLAPDYKLVFTDVAGGQINQGFYYHKVNEQDDEKRNKDKQTWLISRILSAAKAVVGKDFIFTEFPENTPMNTIVDYLFKIIRENSEDKMVNVYATYGTVDRPSQYLGARYFNFVENIDTPSNMSKLMFSKNDQMEKLKADEPKNEGNTSGSNSTADSVIIW